MTGDGSICACARVATACASGRLPGIRRGSASLPLCLRSPVARVKQSGVRSPCGKDRRSHHAPQSSSSAATAARRQLMQEHTKAVIVAADTKQLRNCLERLVKSAGYPPLLLRSSHELRAMALAKNDIVILETNNDVAA